MKSFKVKSKTKEGTEYLVKVDDNGEILCGCNAGKYNVACNHSELIRKFINRKPMLPQDYDRFKEIKE